MKFLVDANLPYSTKELLQKFGETWHVRDVGLSSASDETIAQFATDKEAVLVTRDLGFGNPFLFPLDSHAGVVIIRVPTHFKTEQIHRVFKTFLESAQLDSIQRAVTIVEPGRFRIRK